MTGADAGEVQSTAALVDQLDWQVRLFVLPVAPEPPKIELADATTSARQPGENLLEMSGGKIVERRIRLSRNAPWRRFVLAHELTHWHADGVWDTLLPVLEESLCNWVACALDLRGAEAYRQEALPADVVLQPDVLSWALGLSRDEVTRLSADEHRRWYSVAFRLAERFDNLALRAMAERAQAERRLTVDPQWVHAALLSAPQRH